MVGWGGLCSELMETPYLHSLRQVDLGKDYLLSMPCTFFGPLTADQKLLMMLGPAKGEITPSPSASMRQNNQISIWLSEDDI